MEQRRDPDEKEQISGSSPVSAKSSESIPKLPSFSNIAMQPYAIYPFAGNTMPWGWQYMHMPVGPNAVSAVGAAPGSNSTPPTQNPVYPGGSLLQGPGMQPVVPAFNWSWPIGPVPPPWTFGPSMANYSLPMYAHPHQISCFNPPFYTSSCNQSPSLTQKHGPEEEENSSIELPLSNFKRVRAADDEDARRTEIKRKMTEPVSRKCLTKREGKKSNVVAVINPNDPTSADAAVTTHDYGENKIQDKESKTSESTETDENFKIADSLISDHESSNPSSPIFRKGGGKKVSLMRKRKVVVKSASSKMTEDEKKERREEAEKLYTLIFQMAPDLSKQLDVSVVFDFGRQVAEKYENEYERKPFYLQPNGILFSEPLKQIRDAFELYREKAGLQEEMFENLRSIVYFCRGLSN